MLWQLSEKSRSFNTTKMNSMRKIVAPTDFSRISVNAVKYAADLAVSLNGELVLLHAYFRPLSFSEVPVPAYVAEDIITEAKTKMSSLVEEIASGIANKINIASEIREGEIVSVIRDYCKEINPFAVVMGSETTGALERMMLGGKTIAAVRQLSWPLIVVPDGVKYATIRKIGLACDLRNVQQSIPFTRIKELLKEFDAELHVLHVIADTGDDYSDELIEESTVLQEALGDLKPKYHFIKSDQVEENIVRFADRNRLDLLIIIPKKHTLLSRLFNSSHSKKIVMNSHVPVMAFRE